jgi:hypothetical protein
MDSSGPRRLAWLTLLGAPAALAGGVYALTGQGLSCPFLLATGLLCPLCGGSRMGAALLAGDVGSAWVWNPFLLVVVIVLGLVWAWTLFSVVARRPAALPGLLARVERLAPATWVGLLVVPAVAFGVLRNLG